MKELSFEDIGGMVVTLRAKGDVTRGCVVGVTGRESVGIPEPDGGICGVVQDLAGDGLVSVQMKGFVSVPYTGNVQPGWVSLVANGSGGVQKAGAGVTGHDFLLVSSDSQQRTAVILL